MQEFSIICAEGKIFTPMYVRIVIYLEKVLNSKIAVCIDFSKYEIDARTRVYKARLRPQKQYGNSQRLRWYQTTVLQNHSCLTKGATMNRPWPTAMVLPEKIWQVRVGLYILFCLGAIPLVPVYWLFKTPFKNITALKRSFKRPVWIHKKHTKLRRIVTMMSTISIFLVFMGCFLIVQEAWFKQWCVQTASWAMMGNTLDDWILFIQYYFFFIFFFRLLIVLSN